MSQSRFARETKKQKKRLLTSIGSISLLLQLVEHGNAVSNVFGGGGDLVKQKHGQIRNINSSVSSMLSQLSIVEHIFLMPGISNKQSQSP